MSLWPVSSPQLGRPAPVPRARVLFVSHDASATGAPHSLLNFLDRIGALDTLDFRILLLRGGELAPAFAQRGRACVVREDAPSPHTRAERWIQKLRARFWSAAPSFKWIPTAAEKRRVADFLESFEPDLIYLNSVAAAPALGYFPSYRGPVITYVRELREYVEHTQRTGWFETLAERTSRFLSVSHASKQYLVLHHQIPSSRFSVIPTFIDVQTLDAGSRAAARAELRRLAGASSSDSLIVGCGTTDWRKGPDLFITVAAEFFRAAPDLATRFIWLGGLQAPEEKARITQALRQANVGDRVRFVGAQKNSAALLGGADVLALTSREDPFPRVMLEAGLAEIPTVCFRGTGGGEEFVEKGTGFAVEQLNVTEFAGALRQLLEDSALRLSLGQQARAVVLRDHNAALSAPRILAEIETLIYPAQPHPARRLTSRNEST